MTGDALRSLAGELAAAVEAASAELAAVGEGESEVRPGPAKWSRKEVLGHLIDSAANNHQRFVRARLEGRLTFPRYAQEDWVRAQDYQGAPWSQLVLLWRGYNLHLARLIERMPADRLAAPCRIGDGEPVALESLLRDYVAHLKHHLGQLLPPPRA